MKHTMTELRHSLELHVPCVCIPAYTRAGMEQPDCQHHAAMDWFDYVLAPDLAEKAPA